MEKNKELSASTFLGLQIALIFSVLWQGFILMTAWNLLIPQIFDLPRLTLISAIAIGCVKSAVFLKLDTEKEAEDVPILLLQGVVNGGFIMLVSWILSLFV